MAKRKKGNEAGERFIDRDAELRFLESIYAKKGFKLVVLYGRRRIGKTDLIKEFCKNKPHIYYLCDRRGIQKNVAEFARIASDFFEDVPPEAKDFDEVFGYIKKRAGHQTLVVAIDEFPYLVEKDRAIATVFQKICDEILKETEVMLILCGSSMSIMYRETLSGKSPLYGRRAGVWEVKPLSFADVSRFFPDVNFERKIEFFSIFGNVPAYLSFVDQKLTLKENIIEKIMKKGAPLYKEPELLLKEELRETGSYMNILEAMCSSSKLSEIASKAGIPAKDMPKYLSVLENLVLVRREFPVTKKRSKKTAYFINDNLFYFWFRFCSRNLSYLEEGREDYVFNKYVAPNIQRMISLNFEKICTEFLKKAHVFDYDRLGRWWGFRREHNLRKELEIDIVALNEKTKEILFAECKWKSRVNAEKLCKELSEKAGYVEWNNNKRKEFFAIFAKSFSKRIKEFEGKPVYCFDLKDIMHAFQEKPDKRRV